MNVSAHAGDRRKPKQHFAQGHGSAWRRADTAKLRPAGRGPTAFAACLRRVHATLQPSSLRVRLQHPSPQDPTQFFNRLEAHSTSWPSVRHRVAAGLYAKSSGARLSFTTMSACDSVVIMGLV